MSDIAKQGKIDRLKLDNGSYFSSLIDNAVALGMLTEKDTGIIQYDCFSVLAELSEKYNNGKSSSINTDTAEDILNSIAYTLSVCLKAYEIPDDAVSALKTEGVKELYRRGRKLLDKLLFSTRLLHEHVKKRVFKSQNEFYEATVVDGIDGFFKLYSPDFFAHKTHITVDYPTFLHIDKLSGIEFIRRYLEYINCENELLCSFPAESVRNLLYDYNNKYVMLLFNLFEPVFLSAVGACLIKRDELSDPRLNPYELERLVELLTPLSRQEVAVQLTDAVDSLAIPLSLSDRTVLYLKSCVTRASSVIVSAASIDALPQLFHSPEQHDDTPVFSFSFGGKMPNKRYRMIASRVLRETSPEEKMRIIADNIHTLADFEDILSDGELTDAEIYTVLHRLSPVEFTALVKKHSLGDGMSPTEPHPSELPLIRQLNIILSEMTAEQRGRVLNAASKIELEQ